MSTYDDLFAETAPDESLFVDKGALDPLAEPTEIVARDVQERELATILNGVHDGYLPPTVSIYGPPGTGKTLTTRRVCREFADRRDDVAVEYVNLKECRTLFSVANEILYELTGEKNGAYEGIDGVFESIWSTLDEINHV
jgi:archaeal cell division control protein 6